MYSYRHLPSRHPQIPAETHTARCSPSQIHIVHLGQVPQRTLSAQGTSLRRHPQPRTSHPTGLHSVHLMSSLSQSLSPASTSPSSSPYFRCRHFPQGSLSESLLRSHSFHTGSASRPRSWLHVLPLPVRSVAASRPSSSSSSASSCFSCRLAARRRFLASSSAQMFAEARSPRTPSRGVHRHMVEAPQRGIRVARRRAKTKTTTTADFAAAS